MDRYALRIADGGLVVDTGAAIHQDEDEPASNAAAVRLPAPLTAPPDHDHVWPRQRPAARFSPIRSELEPAP